jgi:hypothetical protein
MRELMGSLVGSSELAACVGKRIDLAFDNFPASVDEIRAALSAGKFVSRTWRPEDVGYRQNSGGSTVYMPDLFFRKDDQRLLRAYDRRGSTRFEVEVVGPDADRLRLALVAAEVSDWPAVAMSFVLRAVDFRDVESFGASHSEQRPRLSWWDSFLGGVRKAVVAPLVRPVPRERSLFEAAQCALDRCSKAVLVVALAWGWKWVERRVEALARGRLDDGDYALIEQLSAIDTGDFRFGDISYRVPADEVPF